VPTWSEPGPRCCGLRIAVAGAAAAAVLACSAVDRRPQDTSTTQPSVTMQRGVAALAALLPVALAPSMWSEPGVARDVERWVSALRASAQDLDAHARQGDVSFAFLSRSLAREAAELERDIALQRYASASERTVRLTGTCTACHARLPAESQDRFADALLTRVDERSLSPFARAELQVATRQFDAALETYEQQFVDPFTPGTLLELSEALPSYLILTLRVRRDADRARRGLSMLAQRRELSPGLRQDLDVWQEALVGIAPALREPPTLEGARALLVEGGGLNDFPWQEADSIHAIVASSVLYRYIEERRPHGEELAEALYLLARSEAFTFRSFELLEPQYYLEQAIRIAPHTEVAERAYAALELETVLINDAFGQPIPEDVREWLEGLRELSVVAPVEPSAGSDSAPQEAQP
jgi:hypothetical protein